MERYNWLEIVIDVLSIVAKHAPSKPKAVKPKAKKMANDSGTVVPKPGAKK